MLLTPQQFQIDQDLAFCGVFSEMCRDLGVPLTTGAAGEKMAFKDMDVREETTGKLAGAHMGQACCRLCNEEGFIPATSVLGEGVHMPASS